MVKSLHYRNPTLRQIAEQHRFAPASVRIMQVDRAEELAFEIQSDDIYNFPDLHRRITNHQTELFPNLEISGADLLHDLRYFLEEVSESVGQVADSLDEPVLTVGEVSDLFSVSTKTIQRWRFKGLPSRVFVFGKRKRVGFRQSCLDRFLELHRDDVDRSRQFTQLTDSERELIVRRARRLARAGANLSDVATRLAKKTGRAFETIRYTLRNFDREFPHAAIFDAPQFGTASRVGSCDPDQQRREPSLPLEVRRDIFRLRQNGVSAGELAVRFGRSKSSIYRIASEHRAHMLRELTLDFIQDPEFESDDALMQFAERPESEELQLVWGDTSSMGPLHTQEGNHLPAYLADLFACPVLTHAQEQYLFRRMHFLRYRADQLRQGLKQNRPNSALMDQIDAILQESNTAKNRLIRFNLRLVVSIARKHRGADGNLFEKISDGNMTLIRAIETFDFRRGTKFSTYATWALMKSYAKSVPAESIHQSRYVTGSQTVFDDEVEVRTTISEDEQRLVAQRNVIETILEQLNEREQDAISWRYALQGQAEVLSVEEIGERLGVTTERARQIINYGLEKLREIAATTNLSLPFE